MGGINLTADDLSEYSVENTLKVFEELKIDPRDFNEVLGCDVFANVIQDQGDVNDNDSDCSDSDTDFGRSVG